MPQLTDAHNDLTFAALVGFLELRGNTYELRMAYAINIRSQQMSSDGTAVRLYQTNYMRAVMLMGQAVMLYRPRGEAESGYYGWAKLSDVERDRQDPKWFWIALCDIVPFARTISLDELYGASFINDTPFYTYSRALRAISPYEMERLGHVDEVSRQPGFADNAAHAEPPATHLGWSTRKVRLRAKLLRDRLIGLYGPQCVLTEKLYTKLDARFFETQTGHVVAIGYGGPDIIQNTLPMSCIANWHWDNGLISLTNSGDILLTSKASADTKALFEHGRRIRFANSQVWPKAEYLEWHRDHIFEKGFQRSLIWQAE